MSDKIQPEMEKGIPICSERCPSYDGKRCDITGFRPSRVCEPAVREIIKQKDEASADTIKAQEAMGNGADDSRWKPGERAVDALIRERDQLRAKSRAATGLYRISDSRRAETRRGMDDFLEEILALRQADELLEAIFREMGPYRGNKVSDETWRKVQDHFNFDDSE